MNINRRVNICTYIANLAHVFKLFEVAASVLFVHKLSQWFPNNCLECRPFIEKTSILVGYDFVFFALFYRCRNSR